MGFGLSVQRLGFVDKIWQSSQLADSTLLLPVIDGRRYRHFGKSTLGNTLEDQMSERIVMRTGEALVGGGPPFTAAEPEVVIGELVAY